MDKSSGSQSFTNMTTKDTDLAISEPRNKSLVRDEQELSEALKKAWDQISPTIGVEAQQQFEKHICNDLEAYLKKIEAACRHQKEKSYLFRFLDWVEPFLKLVELFTPSAAIAIQAYPNPGALAMGGIVALLSITSRIQTIQKHTLRMLARMGRKARVFLAFESQLYKDELEVQKALLAVYSHTITFCDKAVSYVTKNDEFKARVRGLRLFLFRDFESRLGAIVESFENSLEHLETQACLCDKRRLMEVRDSIQAQDGQISKGSTGDFAKPSDLDVKILQIERMLRENAESESRKNIQAKMHAWLSPLDFLSKYEDRCDEQIGGTGDWLLKSDLYKAWKGNDKSGLLWVRGKPGCGKSVLAAVAIHEISLHLERDASIGYLFCRREEQSAQTSSTLLGSLARQICGTHESTNSVLQTEFARYQPGQPPSLRTVKTIMKSILTSFARTYFVIDALDECLNVEELAHELVQLLKYDSDTNVKVLIFSRPDFHLDNQLQSYPQIQPEDKNHEDLRAYIGSLFDDNDPRSLNAKIRQECISKAEGMFLWVKLLQENLKRPLTPSKKLELIQKLPPGLESMYDQILHKVWQQGEEVWSAAFQVLLWVTHTTRPLKRTELYEAVADYRGALRVRDASRYDKPEDLVHMCMNLVVIDKEGYFRLCHDSVRGYLDGSADEANIPLAAYQRRRLKAHQEIAETCMQYLSLEDFKRGPFKSPITLHKFFDRFPLLDYAAKAWGLHVMQTNVRELQDLVLGLILPSDRRDLLIQIAVLDEECVPFSSRSESTSSYLHILSIFGLTTIAKGLPGPENSVYDHDTFGMTPLAYALLKEHYDMSKWLLEQNHTIEFLKLNPVYKMQSIHFGTSLGWVDLLPKLIDQEQSWVDCRSPLSSSTPLITACNWGQIEAVKYLISQDARLDLKRKDGDDALMVATQRGYTDIVRLLLQKGADVMSHDADGATVLHHAAVQGLDEIAMILLEQGADPLARAPKADSQMPLHLAVESQSLNLITALYQRSGRLNEKSERDCTPLHIAAWHNRPRAAQHLLSLGASKDEVDMYGRTPLYIAAMEGALETVQILVEAGCSMTTVDESGITLLHTAARSGNAEVVRYIINKRNADDSMPSIEAKSSEGETALHSAVRSGNADVVKLILGVGANTSGGGIMMSSALHYAAHYGHKKIMRHLLGSMDDVNIRNQDDDTPLHFAVTALNYDWIVDFFHQCKQLSLPIQVDALNRNNRTPLALALYVGAENIARFLLDNQNGSTIKPDNNNNLPIHLAAWHGFDDIVITLMQPENIRKQGYFGRTPLLGAVVKGQLSTVKLLLEKAPDMLEIADEEGKTPVFAAVNNSHSRIALHLLDAQADVKVVDQWKNGLLHVAAARGDLKMVERMLSLGCEADQKNNDGDTAFHLAVRADSVEIVNAFIERGYDDTLVPGRFGNTCAMLAASNGSMEMLQRLHQRGSSYGKKNMFGRNAAHHAADGGHWEVFDFLKLHGEDLYAADLQGYTPLIVAADKGHVDTVRYLLKDCSQLVNQVATQARFSALGRATCRGKPKVTRLLLEAGADPYLRDAFGASPLSYASFYKSTRAEMYRMYHFQDTTSADYRRVTLCQTVVRVCENLLQNPVQRSLQEECDFLDSTSVLMECLITLEDFEPAKEAYFLALLSVEGFQVSMKYKCALCNANRFTGNLYLCKSCPDALILCESCYKDYQGADSAMPEAIREILKLESNVQPLRVASNGCLLLSIAQAMRCFEAGVQWLSTTIEEYETWERNHNAENKYSQLQRPGQHLLKHISQMQNLIDDVDASTNQTTDSLQQFDEFCRNHRKYERKHRPDKELYTFSCQKHEFIAVTTDDVTKFRSSAQKLDRATGGWTNSWISRLKTRYRILADNEISKVKRNAEDIGGVGLPQLDSPILTKGQASPTSADGIHHGARSRHRYPLNRSQSAYFDWKNAGQLNTTDGSVMLSLKSLVARPDLNEPQRAQTLPGIESTSPDARVRNVTIQLKAADALSILPYQQQAGQAHERAPPKMQRPDRHSEARSLSLDLYSSSDTPGISCMTSAKNPGEIIPDETDHVTSSGETTLTLTLSHDPEEIDYEQMHPRPSEPSIVRQAQSSNGVDIVDEDAQLQPVFDDFLHTTYVAINTQDFNVKDVRLWPLAFQLTEAICPGFVEDFLTAKLEEVEIDEIEDVDEVNTPSPLMVNEDMNDKSGVGSSDEGED